MNRVILYRLDMNATLGQGARGELIIRGDNMIRHVQCFSTLPQEISVS